MDNGDNDQSQQGAQEDNLQGDYEDNQQGEFQDNQQEDDDNNQNIENSNFDDDIKRDVSESLNVWNLYLYKQDKVNQAYNNFQYKNQDSLMDSQGANDFIDIVSNILQFDCDGCKIYFQQNNGPFQMKKLISLNDFNTFFEKWSLQLLAQAQVENQQLERDTFFLNEAQAVLNQDQDQGEENQEENIYASHNTLIIKKFLQNHSQEVQSYFEEFSQEKVQNPTISIQQIPLVMRVSFYIDNITFHSSKNNPDEFFNNPNNIQQILNQLKNFLNIKNLDNNNINNQKIDFVQFLEFIDFFSRKEKGLFLKITSEPEKDSKKKNEPKKKLNKDQQRQKNLKEIFEHYSNNLKNQKSIKIEKYVSQDHHLNLSSFIIFCKDFKILDNVIKLNKNELQSLFKKQSKNYYDINFDDFKSLCEKFSSIMYEDKQDQNESEKYESFLGFINLDNPFIYRKSMNISDKDESQSLPKNQTKEVSKVDFNAKMKQELEKRQKQFEEIRLNYNFLTPQVAIKKQSSHVQLILKPSQSHDQSYAKLKQKRSQENRGGQVTWQELQKINNWNLQNSSFKPTDLFDEQDDIDDKKYLKQFSLHEEKSLEIKKKIQKENNKDQSIAMKNQLSPDNKYSNKRQMDKGSMPQLNPLLSPNSGRENLNQNSNNKIGQLYMQRANEVDQEQRKKDKQLLEGYAKKKQVQYQKN